MREVLLERFVKPIAKEAGQISLGRSLSPETPMSAVFFGPPGTSKTELTKCIADYLGWPRLIIDPSIFVRKGMDQVQAEADRIFAMLAVAERIVVLLDEFDEMVRDRQRADEILSRFLTTAMLPKLAMINKNRRIVFIVATNYIDRFDLAISRHGRFDMLLQVMPPTVKEKLRKWPDVAANLRRLGLRANRQIGRQIAALTYDEFRAQVPKLGSAQTARGLRRVLDQAYNNCNLRAVVNPEAKDKKEQKTWEEVCNEQEGKIRVLWP